MHSDGNILRESNLSSHLDVYAYNALFSNPGTIRILLKNKKTGIVLNQVKVLFCREFDSLSNEPKLKAFCLSVFLFSTK